MKNVDYAAWERRACAVAVGFFDGVHRGHAAVVKKLAEHSRVAGLPSVAVCLDHDPALRKERLCSPKDRASLLAAFGTDYVVFALLSREWKARSPEAFFREFLCEHMGAKVFVSGENSVFERHSSIDPESSSRRADSLPDPSRENCPPPAAAQGDWLRGVASESGVELVRVGTVFQDGFPVTTGRVFCEMRRGRVERVNELLGRPLRYSGKIVSGAHKGRTVGMPTANMAIASDLILPGHGVYGTLMKVRERWYRGLTNIGTRPSVDSFDTVTVETYLPDFGGSIYGEDVELEIHAYIRGIRKFNRISEVRRQVDRDIVHIGPRLKKLVDEREAGGKG